MVDGAGAEAMGRQANRFGPALAAGLCAATAAWGAPRQGPADCRPALARADSLDALGPRGEIRLASGSRVVLGSLRWPEDAQVAARAGDWLLALRGRPLTIVPRGEGDRWGRLRIDASVDEEGIDLAGGLIDAGLAWADSGEADTLCRPALLRVEAGARAAKRGLWQASLPEAGDGAALRARAGGFAVIEGRVRHVGERASRTYLDFVRRGEDGLTVTVSKRTWRRMLEHGLSAAGIEGRRVRVRGVIELWRSPVIDVGAPELIEPLDDEAAPAEASDRRPGAGPAGMERDGERAPRR
ncbi:thermonuclease family protein [Methylobacterium trifolii]